MRFDEFIGNTRIVDRLRQKLREGRFPHALIFAGPGADGSMVAWRWMFGILAAPSVAFFFLVLQIPESPRWLVKQQVPED